MIPPKRVAIPSRLLVEAGQIQDKNGPNCEVLLSVTTKATFVRAVLDKPWLIIDGPDLDPEDIYAISEPVAT